MTARTTEIAPDLWPLLDRREIGIRLSHQWLIPPDIRLDGEVLRYGEVDEPERLKTVRNPSMKLLDGFLMLADAEPEAIERYAQRWGVLGLCQHNYLVAGHEPHPELGGETCRLEYAEPIERWRYFAAAFKQLLNEGAMLRDRGKLKLRGRGAQEQVGNFVNTCYRVVLYFGGLRPVLVVEDGRFDIKLAGGSYLTGLPAALTTQFLFFVAGAAGISNCASCGRLFLPRRRPRANENSYCPECGIRAAWREGQRRRRAKTTGHQIYAERTSQGVKK